MTQVPVHLAAKEDDADLELVILPNSDTRRGHFFLTDGAALSLAFDLLRAVIQGKRRS